MQKRMDDENMKKKNNWREFALIIAAAVSLTACKTAVKEIDSATTAYREAAAATGSETNGGGTETSETAGSKLDAPAEVSTESRGGFQTLAPADTEDGGLGPAKAVTGEEPKVGDDLSGIPIDAEKSEAVSIYYGSVCYSYFSEEKEKIRQTADLFTGFSLEEVPDGALDAATTYQIYFSTDTEQIAAVNVDQNGMFYIPEEKKVYKVKAGTFHFEELDQIYKESMYADGFDEDQCLIQ